MVLATAVGAASSRGVEAPTVLSLEVPERWVATPLPELVRLFGALDVGGVNVVVPADSRHGPPERAQNAFLRLRVARLGFGGRCPGRREVVPYPGDRELNEAFRSGKTA